LGKPVWLHLVLYVTKTVAGGGQSPNPLEGADKNPPEENQIM